MKKNCRKRIRISLFFILFFIGCKTDPFIHWVHTYQNEETQYNGDRCPLYPTCSEYFIQSYQENSWLGFFLTWERLFIRERGDLSKKFHPINRLELKKKYFYDPVQNSWRKVSLLKDNF